MSDIIDTIGQLIDQQLAAGPVDDYNVNRYDKCPHCQRDWHGMPVTVRIAQMYATGQFEDDYQIADDDTPVLCEGPEFIGPQRAWPEMFKFKYQGYVDTLSRFISDVLLGEFTLPDDPFDPNEDGRQ